MKYHILQHIQFGNRGTTGPAASPQVDPHGNTGPKPDSIEIAVPAEHHDSAPPQPASYVKVTFQSVAAPESGPHNNGHRANATFRCCSPRILCITPACGTARRFELGIDAAILHSLAAYRSEIPMLPITALPGCPSVRTGYAPTARAASHGKSPQCMVPFRWPHRSLRNQRPRQGLANGRIPSWGQWISRLISTCSLR